jgi:UbiD family decarboxylase
MNTYLHPGGVTKCKTVDLEVPSSSEINLEGKIFPKIRVNEGTFLDYSGIPKVDPNAPVFEVSCLMYRNNPIFRGAAIGQPGAEDHLLYALLSNAHSLDFHGSKMRQEIQNALLRKGFLNIFQKIGRLGQLLRKNKII